MIAPPLTTSLETFQKIEQETVIPAFKFFLQGKRPDSETSGFPRAIVCQAFYRLIFEIYKEQSRTSLKKEGANGR